MGAEDQTIPQWAADLRVSVARIEGRTEQIPEITKALEELRANTVPMTEHVKLMNDVEELKVRDVGSRTEWDEIRTQVPKLWEERAMMRGALALVSIVVAALTIFTLLNQLGIDVQVGKH